MAIGDFHLHSTASDGLQSPGWVVERAAANGVRVLSLTDHDTTAGLAEAARTADHLGLHLIPGIELSTDLGAADVHLLGYGFNQDAKPLQEFLAWQREGRRARLERIVQILADEGAPVELARVLAIAGDATVGRPHVARALIERGHVATIQEAFDRWLGNGQVADVPRPKLPPPDAIKLVHDHGGVVFVAHPLFIGDGYVGALDQLAGWGLDGIETYYKHYDAATVAYHRQVAERHGLATSGGSDFHGLGNPGDREIGDIPFPDAAVEAFVQFIESRCACTRVKGVIRA